MRHDDGQDEGAERPAGRRFDGRSRQRNKAAPLDDTRLRDLAMNYLGRYATSRARLARYLARKLAERGWEGGSPADVDGLLDRLEELGYLDDEAYAQIRGASLSRRGYGRRRIEQDLRHRGIDGEAIERLVQQNEESDEPGDAWGAVSAHEAFDHVSAALKLARRKRIGPFDRHEKDEKARQKQIAMLVRGGHSFALARYIVDQPPGTDPDRIRAEAPRE